MRSGAGWRSGFVRSALFLGVAAVSFAQTKSAFEVAVVKPAAPLDMQKLAQQVQAGQMPRMGAHVEAGRAEYTYMAMKELISLAYGVKPFQITGPAWMSTTRFDIVAKMPEGSQKAEAPAMLKTLLEERFKLKAQKAKSEHPVLGLVVGKGGPKLVASATEPQPIDESVPLKPGEITTEGPDGPVRMTIGKNGNATINMGTKGTMSYAVDPVAKTFHLQGDMITMSGFADMLTQFSNMFSQGQGGRQVVDMTDIKGSYKVSMDFAMADLLAMARSAGMDIPPGAGGQAEGASDPGGASSSITTAVQALGLKLEPRKAMIEQLIVESVEKTPTEN